MGLKKLQDAMRGWIPKDPTIPLPIEIASPNSKPINKKLITGSVAICLIILVFGLFIYMLSHPPTRGLGIGYPIKYEVDESLQPYIELGSAGMQGSSWGTDDGGSAGWMVLNGTVSWIGEPQDSVKSLKNIHLVVYTRIDEKTYVNGTLTHLYIASHIQAFPNEPTLPNDTIDQVKMIIPEIGLDTPTYQYNVNCSTSLSKSDLERT